MKRLFAFTFVLALASIPAFAAKNSQSVTVPEAVSVGSTQLPAGNYKITWTGSGPSVQVTLKQQDVRTPATATTQAKLVSENHGHAAVTINNQGGSKTIELIQLDHVSLVLGSAPSSGQ
ncbi:MAG TPA: hypothetical protein VG267_01360 [Terracidiphilus sp.]|jgi:curli biogenesis system outer membrane secretion channel CsgG|nr:hypothetical protein [Terracidiphilus sp.]